MLIPMNFKPNGELIPEGGGDNIPLIRERLTVGRRDSCDICLRYANISGLHCELLFREGFWWVKDLGSTNGLKINGVNVPRKLLHPGDRITIAKRTYTINYDMPAGEPAEEELTEVITDDEIFNTPLLERAGLVKPQEQETKLLPSRQAIANALQANQSAPEAEKAE